MIEFIKLWVFIALIFWVILLWQWEWTSLILGHKKVPIKNPDYPWWKRPKEEWVECEPTVLHAAWFALAWPFLICALPGAFIVYILSRMK